jgi:HlyD family secretion protein
LSAGSAPAAPETGQKPGYPPGTAVAGRRVVLASSSTMDRPIARPKRRPFHLLAAGLVAAALVAGAARLASPHVKRWSAAEGSVAAASLRTARVAAGDIVRDAPAQGRVVAARHPTLYAPASGLVNLSVRAGDAVKKGDTLLRIDSPELRSRLAQETATLGVLRSATARQSLAIRQIGLREAQAVALLEVRLSAAHRQREAAKLAFEQAVMTRLAFAKAEDDARLAELELVHARDTARLEEELAAFDYRDKGLQAERQAAVVAELTRLVDGLTVTAPFDGTVATLAVADRDAVQQNTPLLTIVDLSANEIEIALADGWAADAAPGTTAEILHEGHPVPGHVTTVSPEVKDGQVKGTVAFDGASPPGLKQGQKVSVRLVFETKRGVLKLPRGPFVESGGGRVAYVVEGGVAQKRAIVIGVTNVSEVEITSGLSLGENVVVSDTTPFSLAATVLLSGGGN